MSRGAAAAAASVQVQVLKEKPPQVLLLVEEEEVQEVGEVLLTEESLFLSSLIGQFSVSDVCSLTFRSSSDLQPWELEVLMEVLMESSRNQKLDLLDQNQQQVFGGFSFKSFVRSV
ncbi:Hypothetical predicted protein [Xyrichtys novacula]|uniref:Uncharacterized protein n=1 Tax=Xyrichtys novacula TaxID=13765 RepID=A0AAV1GLM0_XYRNO|nr:Hypothetical predicted protein [Xyrichtys novacula]